MTSILRQSGTKFVRVAIWLPLLGIRIGSYSVRYPDQMSYPLPRDIGRIGLGVDLGDIQAGGHQCALVVPTVPGECLRPTRNGLFYRADPTTIEAEYTDLHRPSGVHFKQ